MQSDRSSTPKHVPKHRNMKALESIGEEKSIKSCSELRGLLGYEVRPSTRRIELSPGPPKRVESREKSGFRSDLK